MTTAGRHQTFHRGPRGERMRIREIQSGQEILDDATRVTFRQSDSAGNTRGRTVDTHESHDCDVPL